MIPTVRWKYGFWQMLVVALVVRLVIAVLVQAYISRTPDRLCLIAGDAEGYWELAGKIAGFEDYTIHFPPRQVMRMPGFPALLAIPRLIFGNNPFAARMVLALVGVAATVLTYWLGRALDGETVGLVAGTYTIFSPALALFSVLFLSETAFAATLLASLIAAANLARMLSSPTTDQTTKPVWLAIITGLLIGAATYMRPTWLLVGPGIAVLLCLFGKTLIRTRLICAAGVCIGLAVAMFPWAARNQLVTGHFVPTTLWAGPSLYDGLHPGANGDSNMEFFDQENLMQRMSEYEMDREYSRRAKEYAFNHPVRVIELALVKQSRYWSPAPNSEQFSGTLLKILAWLAYLPLILFSLVGIWFVRRDVWLLVLTVAPLFYFAGLHLLFVGSLRYRLPAEYPLAVLASVGFVRLLNRGFKTTIV